MKIKINTNSVNFEEFKKFLVNKYPNMRFWELPNNRILAEKNKLVGCYITPDKKNITLVGGFPDVRINILAVIITILGGFFVPIAIYYLIFYRMHKKFECTLAETITNVVNR